MARKLRFFREQMARAGLSLSSNSPGAPDFDLDNLEVVRLYDVEFSSFSSSFFLFLFFPNYLGPVAFPWLWQVKLGEFEAELLEINDNNVKLQRNYSELLEYKLVLQKVWDVFIDKELLKFC